MVGGRLTRFCFPLMNMVMYSFCRRFFSAFSAAVSFRLRFAMMDIALFLSQRHEYFSVMPEHSGVLIEIVCTHLLRVFQYLIPAAPS
jgi:hypothetical protein